MSKDLIWILIVAAVALAIWSFQERTAAALAVQRCCSRVVKSAAFVNVVVVICATLPVIAVVTAFWTGDWRWLVLLFFLCPFFI